MFFSFAGNRILPGVAKAKKRMSQQIFADGGYVFFPWWFRARVMWQISVRGNIRLLVFVACLLHDIDRPGQQNVSTPYVFLPLYPA